MPKKERGHLAVEAENNWEHNEQTVDGRTTRHAMTKVFLQGKSKHIMPTDQEDLYPKANLNLSFIQIWDLPKLLTNCKQKTRPEPLFWPDVLQIELQELNNTESFNSKW